MKDKTVEIKVKGRTCTFGESIIPYPSNLDSYRRKCTNHKLSLLTWSYRRSLGQSLLIRPPPLTGKDPLVCHVNLNLTSAIHTHADITRTWTKQNIKWPKFLTKVSGEKSLMSELCHGGFQLYITRVNWNHPEHTSFLPPGRSAFESGASWKQCLGSAEQQQGQRQAWGHCWTEPSQELVMQGWTAEH